MPPCDPFYDVHTATLGCKLRCLSCSRYFNLLDRWPFALKCRHAICGPCMATSLNHSPDHVVCRQCQGETKVQGSNIAQFELDEWALTVLRYLTPSDMKFDFGALDVPYLLNNIRHEVSSGIFSRPSSDETDVKMDWQVAGPLGGVEDAVGAAAVDYTRRKGSAEIITSEKKAGEGSSGDENSTVNAGYGRPDASEASHEEGSSLASMNTTLLDSLPPSTPMWHSQHGPDLPQAPSRKKAPHANLQDVTNEGALVGPKGSKSDQGAAGMGQPSPPPPPPPRREPLMPANHPENSTRPEVKINPVLEKFASLVIKLGKKDLDEMCTICMCQLHEESPYDEEENKDAVVVGSKVVRLVCSHLLHLSCALQLITHQPRKDFFKCSTCNQVHGTLMGDQPEGGRMMVSVEKGPQRNYNLRSGSHQPAGLSLPGFEGYDTYIIQYTFPAGVQGPNHPSPGKCYRLDGFPRVGFLPATPKGFEVLCMLKVAFDRGLTFTVGTSSTSGTPDCVVWTGIHHKTMISEGEHGYPDRTYLDRVTKELKIFGVTPTDIPSDPKKAYGWSF